MKNRYINIFLLITAIFFLFSCISSPETKYQSATKLREKVHKYSLQKYAEDEYKIAEQEYQEAKTLIDSKKNFKADKKLDNVNQKYQSVIEKGFPPCTEDKDKIVKEKKEKALEIKAEVAVKDQYVEAEQTYNEALDYKNNKEYEKAIDTLNIAEEQFIDIYNIAEEKKIRAENSIKSTEEAFQKIKEDSITLEEELMESEK
jgi:hypothetical protein